MTSKIKSIALAALSFAALPLFGASYSYNGLTWYDTVSPGKWTSKYNSAKSYAKSNYAPMIVVWASPTCTYCNRFEDAVGGNSAFKTWAESRGYVLVFVLGQSANSSWGLTQKDAEDAFDFARIGLSKFPFVGIWWPKKGGGEVKAHFTGRSGSMTVKSGSSLAQQFMDSVDHHVGAYASVAPKSCTITFNANGGAFRQSGDKTRIVMVGKAVGTLPELKDRSGYRMSGWFTEKSGGTAVSSSTKVTGNVTYYAQWKKTVTLTLSASPLGAGTLSGGGVYDEEKSVTLKATPRNGYVFSCWKKGSAVVSQSAKFPYTLGTANVALTAVFITKRQDFESVALEVDNVAQSTSVVHEVALVQGVNVRWPVLASALTAATPSVSGLPSGMKLVQDKATGEYSISGAPTAVSKKDSKTGEAKPSAVTIKVKTAGGNTVSYKMSLVVEPRPDWAVGAFNGGVFDGASPVGLVGSLTVAANGKISGKLLRDGKTYALSAASFDAYEGRVFRATVIGKNGKELVTNAVAVASEAIVAPGGGETLRGVVNGESYSSSWCAWQNLWKSSDWKALAKKVAKAKKLDMPDGVALKFSSSGAVAAKFGGYSCSTVLIPSGDSDFFLFLYFPPKAGKFDGYNTRACVCWDGENFSGQVSND